MTIFAHDLLKIIWALLQRIFKYITLILEAKSLWLTRTSAIEENLLRDPENIYNL